MPRKKKSVVGATTTTTTASTSGSTPASPTTSKPAAKLPDVPVDPESVLSNERKDLLARLLDGAIPPNEQAQLLALRGFWPGFIGQINVGPKKIKSAPGAVCTVSQGLTHPDMPNKRLIVRETINAKGERAVYIQNKDPSKVVVPPKGSAGYGFEFSLWTKTRDTEVFEVFNHLVTELLLHDVDYLSLVSQAPFYVLIDLVVYGRQAWPVLLSLPAASSPLHGTHSLSNGSFQFIQVLVLTPEEHLSLSFPGTDTLKLLEAGPRGLTDRSRDSVVAFDPKSHPASLDHLRQAVFENDLSAVERWVAGTLALKPQDFKTDVLVEGVCYRDHPLVLACRKGRNPAIFLALFKALPLLPMLRTRFRSSKAPSRLVHVYFEAITQDQPLIVKELLRADKELKVDVDVRCLAQQETGLHLACLNQATPEMVSILLEHKADIQCKMDGEVTCIMNAAQAGNHEVLTLLLRHAQGFLTDTAFKALLNAREVKGATALMLAALCDQPKCVEVLLANGADKTLSLQGPAEVMTAQDFAKMGKSQACFVLLGGQAEDLEDAMPNLV